MPEWSQHAGEYGADWTVRHGPSTIQQDDAVGRIGHESGVMGRDHGGYASTRELAQ